jgi:Ca2+-dependent lipid-binding protein
MLNTHPYSGTSPIPKIDDFLEEQRQKLPGSSKNDGGKEEKTTKENAPREQTKALKHGQGAKDENRRTVKDPTTGNEVEIEDANADFKKEAENPELVVPKTALPDRSVNERDFAGPTQPIEEYSDKQDVTAPPAPVKPGTTADVPIRGEKTNVSPIY